MKGQAQRKAETVDRFILHQEMLADDLNYLYHCHYFPNFIRLESFEQFIHSIKTDTDLESSQTNRNILKMFLNCIVNIVRYDPYVIMKWFVYIHSLLTLLESKKLVDCILEALNAIELPFVLRRHDLGNYQKYICNTLLKAYLQYLCRMFTIRSKTIILEQRFPLQRQNNENICQINIQNIPQLLPKKQSSQNNKNMKSTVYQDRKKTYTLELWFQIFNLICFTFQQFPRCIQQTKQYFKQFYPYLTNFSKLMKKDLSILSDIIKNQYKKIGEESFMSIIEIETLNVKLDKFNKICSDEGKQAISLYSIYPVKSLVQDEVTHSFLNLQSGQKAWIANKQNEEFIQLQRQKMIKFMQTSQKLTKNACYDIIHIQEKKLDNNSESSPIKGPEKEIQLDKDLNLDEWQVCQLCDQSVQC